jgi:protein ImuB
MLGGFEHGNVVRIDGPYVVAGGWWAGAGGGEVRREVHFAETSKGRLFWIYYDVRRRRWFLLGEVS